MVTPSEGDLATFRTDVPHNARMYDYALGGKDNFAADRQAVLAVCERFPEAVDESHGNRLYLYRVVRFLARDAGIRQFLDLGSGLPTQDNVHQVAQRFQPDAQVAYVDHDPIVLAHGRALLADERTTTVIAADMKEPVRVLDHPDTQRMIDFAQPMAVLMLGIGHHVVDDAVLRRMLAGFWDALAAGSYLAYSHIVGIDRAAAEEANELMLTEFGVPWKNRVKEDVVHQLSGLRQVEFVEPGLVDVADWRPDPDQPALGGVDQPLRRYLGASDSDKRSMVFGGVLRKTAQ